MGSRPETRGDAKRRWLVVAALLPLALLFVASALGIAVPMRLHLAVVLWSVLLLLWGQRERGSEGAAARGPSGTPGPGAASQAETSGPAPSAAVPKRRAWLNGVLLVATLVTTTFAGAAHQGVNLLEKPAMWRLGLPYALGLMLVLGVHEMGHYLTARRYGLRPSLPYFVPVPFALGTFGAFIALPPLVRNRRQLFDVGVAGPLAGLAVAIPALALGLRWSTALPFDPAAGVPGHGVSANASVLLALVARAAAGDVVAKGHYLVLHPLAFAGWLGVTITALNLLPIGQLDGGHIAHALFGKARADWLGKVAIGAMVALGIFVWSGFLFWALLVLLVAGTSGAAPQDDLTPLDGGRRFLAWTSFALLALILLPFPHALSSGLGLHCPYV